MAFVNEKLTPTQREELAKKKIKNPYENSCCACIVNTMNET